MTDTRADRQLIADVIKHSSTGKLRWECSSSSTNVFRTAAPELARRLSALLDALDDPENTRCGCCGLKIDQRHIRAAYTRNLERSKP